VSASNPFKKNEQRSEGAFILGYELNKSKLLDAFIVFSYEPIQAQTASEVVCDITFLADNSYSMNMGTPSGHQGSKI